MSGGHFEYNCFRISQFADDLLHEIQINKSKKRNEWDEVTACNFNENTIQILKECHLIIETAGKLAREIEYLYSDDHGEESFMEIVEPILNIYKEENA